MIRLQQKKISTIIAILVLLTTHLFFTSCNKDDPSAPQEDAPPIPPASTFFIDLDEFPDTTQSPSLPLSGQPGFNKILSHQNWGWAALNIAVWNTAITLTMIVPVAAFVESFNHEPVQQPDGSWLWSYNFSATGAVHTAKLSARAESGDIHWKMLISRQGAYTDFEWYTGVSNLVATEGTWRLNMDPNTSPPTPFLDIEWHRNPQAGSADVKYTNIIPGHIANGDYLFYGINNETPYNAFYDVFSNNAGNLVEIEWDRAENQKDGRIKDPNHFGDDQYHCWDIIANGLEDITCP